METQLGKQLTLLRLFEMKGRAMRDLSSFETRRGLRGVFLLFVGLSLLVPMKVEASEKAAQGERELITLSPEVGRKCLQVLREGLRGDEFWPSIHAAEGLTLAGYREEVRNYLAPKMGKEKDDQKRCGLARELVRAGDRSYASVMLDILAGDDPHGHVHACESLYKVGELGDGRLLRQAFRQEENVPMRLMAAGALARSGNGKALSFLREELQNEDEDLARIAAWLVGRIGDESDIPRLRARMKTIEGRLAECYFEHALAALGDEEGLKKLKANLSDEDGAVRTYAATFAGDARAVSLKDELIALLDDPVLDARIRAAQTLLSLGQPIAAGDGAIVRDVYEATKTNPRYSEGSIVVLRDGTLLFAVTEFFESGSDFSRARIIGRESLDGGRTWSEPRVLQKNVGERNVMSVTLRWLESPLRKETPLGMFYLVKNGPDDLDVYLRVSQDGGKTFGKPRLVTIDLGYHVMNNDRVEVLSSGRLLVPVASTEDAHKENHYVSRCFFSDDGGKSWQKGAESVDLPKRGAMEPGVFERKDGKVGMFMRTQLGQIAVSESADGGDTWSEPEFWPVQAPESASTVRRIPATGDLVLIWNNNYRKGAGHGGKRNPLSAAISSDDGETWKQVRNLESESGKTYSYPSLVFHQGRALLSYYVRDEESGRISTRFRSVPVGWFYEKKK